MSDYTFPPNIVELVQAKEYKQVISMSMASDFDRDEAVWRANRLHTILLEDKANLYNIEFWRSHYDALQEGLAETEEHSEIFHVSLMNYLRQLKTICLRETIGWIGDEIIESVKENRYDAVAAICHGVERSRYVPMKAPVVLWLGVERLMNGRVSNEPDHVQLQYLHAFLSSVNEWDSELARETLSEAQSQNETESFKMLGRATVSNAIGHLGSFEIRWPGFSILRLPQQDTSDKQSEIMSLASHVANNVNSRYLVKFSGYKADEEANSE